MASITSPDHFKSFTVSDGTKYGYIKIAAQPGKPTLLFLHGYPSSSYHWHNQVQQCIDAGYGMIAPDLLGYGDTSKPTEVSAYDNTVTSTHVIEILDYENEPVVVGVGHDWGAIMMSTTARMFPKRFSLLVFLTVGYSPGQAAMTNIDAINALTTKLVGRPLLGYWPFLNSSEAASVIESAEPSSLASLFYPADPHIWSDNWCPPGTMEEWIKERKATKLAPWMKQSELDTHNKILKAGGYTGPLNWFKQGMAGVTHGSELKINPEYGAIKITTPTLFVGCENDMVCPPVFQLARMKDYIQDLTVKSLESSHWVMIEKPKELWEIVQEWIEEKGKAA